MPVNPDFQKILDIVNRLPTPDYSRSPTELALEMRALPVLIPPLRNSVAVEVRTVPGAYGHAVPIRIYRPPSVQPHGVLVSLHGGGWVAGSLDSDEFKCHLLAYDSGCAVVSVDYRMAPEHPFPIPAEDCYAVTAWVATNSRELGFDANRVGIGGSSAGGNLAAAVALMARDRCGPALRCQLLTYPVCDHDFERSSYLDHAEGKLLSRTQMMWFWDVYAGESARDNPYLSPVRATDLKAIPPALVITAEYDPLRDEGEHYARLLSDAGNDVKLVRMKGLIHGFLSLAIQHPKSMEALRLTVDMMKRYLSAP